MGELEVEVVVVVAEVLLFTPPEPALVEVPLVAVVVDVVVMGPPEEGAFALAISSFKLAGSLALCA